jgi:hypothetical protein
MFVWRFRLLCWPQSTMRRPAGARAQHDLRVIVVDCVLCLWVSGARDSAVSDQPRFGCTSLAHANAPGQIVLRVKEAALGHTSRRAQATSVDSVRRLRMALASRSTLCRVTGAPARRTGNTSLFRTRDRRPPPYPFCAGRPSTIMSQKRAHLSPRPVPGIGRLFLAEAEGRDDRVFKPSPHAAPADPGRKALRFTEVLR